MFIVAKLQVPAPGGISSSGVAPSTCAASSITSSSTGKWALRAAGGAPRAPAARQSGRAAGAWPPPTRSSSRAASSSSASSRRKTERCDQAASSRSRCISRSSSCSAWPLSSAAAWAFKNLPVEAFPDVTDTQVTVITLYPGRAAEEVEKQVTIPIEVGLCGLPNAVRMFSHTQFGLSFIIITFNDKANDYFARQQVLERLRDVELPEGVRPQLAPLSTRDRRDLPLSRQRRQARPHRAAHARRTGWSSARCGSCPGVADIVSLGGFIKQYEVKPDLAKLATTTSPCSSCSHALERGNANAGGGYVEQGRQQYLIRGIGLLRSARRIGNIVVARARRHAVLVSDIARRRLSARCRARASSGRTRRTTSSPASCSCARARIRPKC